MNALKKSNYFITGDINVGKSTVLGKILNDPYFIGKKVMGFRTVPLIEADMVQGYQLSSLDGEMECFAHIDWQSDHIFNKFFVDISIFETHGVKLLQKAMYKANVIVFDEVGVMEQNALNFRKMLIQCVESEKLMLGVIQQRARWFFDLLEGRKDAAFFEITPKNRENMAECLLNWIKNSNI